MDSRYRSLKLAYSLDFSWIYSYFPYHSVQKIFHSAHLLYSQYQFPKYRQFWLFFQATSAHHHSPFQKNHDGFVDFPQALEVTALNTSRQDQAFHRWYLALTKSALLKDRYRQFPQHCWFFSYSGFNLDLGLLMEFAEALELILLLVKGGFLED